jgi:hypothetical protein
VFPIYCEFDLTNNGELQGSLSIFLGVHAALLLGGGYGYVKAEACYSADA